ncbi:putative reverse transcriptase domain-containing protein [Tanacetum coccineum]
MPLRIRTRSAGRPIAKSRGGGMGKWVGRSGRDRGPREGNDEHVDELNGQGNDQGLGANRGVEGVNGNVEGVNRGVGGAPNLSMIIAQQLQNLLPAMLAQKMESVQDMSGFSIDQKVKYTVGLFLGKALTWWNSQICTLSQEVTVSMSWNDFKFMMIEEFCPSHEMQKLEIELWNHAMVGAGHAAYTDRFHELARLVPHLVTLESRKIKGYVYGLAPQICRMVEAMEPKTMQKAVQISGALTDEAIRNGSIKKVEKKEMWGNLARIRMVGMIIRGLGLEILFLLGHLAKDCRGMPRNVNPVNARNPTVRACYECGSTDHVRSASPRLNRAQGPERNRPNQVAANNGGQGDRNQGNQAWSRAFMLGAKEAR